jgi:uncharacterized protein (TIGR00297 family)
MVYLIISLNALIAAAAYRRSSVSRSGGVLGAVVGAGIWLAGGIMLWGLLAFFFASSTILSRIGSIKKRSLEIIHAKNDIRDAAQVLANGGVALAAAVGYSIFSHTIFLCMFAASLASATADTWASEIGFLSKKKPVLITNGRTVLPGMSGGVTPLGTAMSALGAGAAAAVFAFALSHMGVAFSKSVSIVIIVTLSGITGALVDSLLGATLQAHYIHHEKKIITERSTLDGKTLPLYKGISWITNDTVNAMSAASAAAISAGLYTLCI